MFSIKNNVVTELMESLLFDIGANCGNYTRANIHKYNRVVCVDASSLQCEILTASVPADKCSIVNALISSNTNAEFYRCSASGISSASEEWRKGKGRFAPGGPYFEAGFQWVQESCHIISLDKLIQLYGEPSFIKIDVEGHELEVIKSLTKYDGVLAFEWAEEMKDEAMETLKYIHEKLGHTQFFIQFEDAYTFEPPADQYRNIDDILNEIQNQWVTQRKVLWGMIWSKK
jgi:FkbM family methyltransferase